MEHLEHAVAEQAVRAIISEYPHLPIVAEFYRGWGEDRDVVCTDAASSRFVLVKPASLSVAVSANGPAPLGSNIIGRAVSVDYPRQGGRVDLGALAGSRFYMDLLAAIRAKAAVLEDVAP